MSEELSQPKYIKLGLALYALIFTLIALDIAEDYGDGMDWGHVSIELLVLLMAVMGLTQAESEIGLLILKGFSHQEIADIRSASERTVREQARALYRKAGLTGRASLSAFFLEDLLLPTAPTT